MNMISQDAFLAATRPLRGRVAVVTGSTSGIGLGIAQAFAAAGASVVLNGLASREAVGRILEDIEAQGVRAMFSDADMTDPAAIEGMITGALDAFDRIDILVNNAGIQHVAPVEQFPPEKWDRILSVNLSAAFHAIRSALPAMRRQGGGRIVNVASAHGLVASPFKAAYVAAKHGVVGLTKTVALETAEHGITCNAICPGYVWTPLVEAQIEAQAQSHGIPREEVVRNVLLAQQPNKRFATVEEIGALAVFLAGEKATSITGAAIPVDGAWTSH
ncbi:MAG TPA: 3-hydroxybutyrate dehydrogenase [Microvirga sp.]|nr:3-hydroxybutyrate dehydrogenase [Microvirga sp.]